MTSLRSKAQRRWRAFQALPAGERFERFHEQQKDAPAWVKPVLIVGVLASLAIGVVLVFIPGPAFVFFGLAGALLATQSALVARALDRAEVWARSLVGHIRERWSAWRHRGISQRRPEDGAHDVETLPPPVAVGDVRPPALRSGRDGAPLTR